MEQKTNEFTRKSNIKHLWWRDLHTLAISSENTILLRAPATGNCRLETVMSWNWRISPFYQNRTIVTIFHPWRIGRLCSTKRVLGTLLRLWICVNCCLFLGCIPVFTNIGRYISCNKLYCASLSSLKGQHYFK